MNDRRFYHIERLVLYISIKDLLSYIFSFINNFDNYISSNKFNITLRENHVYLLLLEDLILIYIFVLIICFLLNKEFNKNIMYEILNSFINNYQ